jgi:hypothetical protein
MYNINGQVFKTKKDIHKYVSEVIQTNGFYDILPNSSHYKLFAELVDNHPDREERLKWGLQYFKIIENKYRQPELQIVRNDGVVEPLSWVKCIAGIPRPKPKAP